VENAKNEEVDGVKNQSGQWKGPGGGELNGCIMHQVHTNETKKIKIKILLYSWIPIGTYNTSLAIWKFFLDIWRI
jgi:hypothetical protein